MVGVSRIIRTVASRLLKRFRFRLYISSQSFLTRSVHEAGVSADMPTEFFVALSVTGLNNLRFENVSIGVS